ncbi:MAG: ubiquinone/menaquinone biosynthesis methyltransferase [bacterium]|nr:ubiquinone/menaquinone biosynthesis methyltransferase [bacterium]
MSPETPAVVELFDHIAPIYDRLNRVISWGRDRVWRHDLSLHMELRPGQSVLDVSAGTGDMESTIKAICPEISVIGVDPSRNMLNFYRAKVPKSLILQGVAEAISLRDNSIDRVVCTFGLRNFRDRVAAYAEILRVLRPGGLWGFLEMSAPSGIFFPWLYGLYFKRIVPTIGAKLSRNPYAYQYLADSVYKFPGREIMTAEHQRAGFVPVYYRPIMRGAVGMYVFRK